MRSGFVRLEPGETVGWYTTGQNEEALVILRSEGAASIEGHPKQEFAAPAFALAFIPPATRHNVENTGRELLEYVYLVAPAKLASAFHASLDIANRPLPRFIEMAAPQPRIPENAAEAENHAALSARILPWTSLT